MTEPAPPTFVQRRFRTMGAEAHLLVRATPQIAEPALDAAEADLQRLHGILTRFEPDSPLNQLNDAGMGAVQPDLAALLTIAQAAWHATDGRVDIGIGSDLIAAGYDRSFDELDAGIEGAPDQPEVEIAATSHPLTNGTVPVDRSLLERPTTPPCIVLPGGLVEVRAGTRLDLGGIAKGWAADRICAQLAPLGSCLVSLGGDLSVFVAPDDEPWPVGVALGAGDTTISLGYGGLATSGRDRRTWRQPGGARAHHIIDPKTGLPSETDIVRITVVAGTCAEAEVWSKALMLVGVDEARAEAQRRDLTSIIVGGDGRTCFTGDLAALGDR